MNCHCQRSKDVLHMFYALFDSETHFSLQIFYHSMKHVTVEYSFRLRLLDQHAILHYIDFLYKCFEN